MAAVALTEVVATVAAATVAVATAVDTVAVEATVGSRAGPSRFVSRPCGVELARFLSACCVSLERQDVKMLCWGRKRYPYVYWLAPIFDKFGPGFFCPGNFKIRLLPISTG